MALAPKTAHRRLRESVRFVDGLAQPSSIEDIINPQAPNQTSGKSTQELEEWRSFGEQVAATLEANEIEGWRDWADEIFPITGGYTVTELVELEERLIVRSQRHEKAHYRKEDEGYNFHDRLKRVLTSLAIDDSRKFASVFRNVHSYLAWAKKRMPEELSSYGKGVSLARLILPLYVRYGYENSGAPGYAQLRFSMLFSDITNAVPGVVHALNLLLFAQAANVTGQYHVSGNGLHPEIQENGVAPRQGQHYINRRFAPELLPMNLVRVNGKLTAPVYQAQTPASYPKGLQQALNPLRGSPLPGLF